MYEIVIRDPELAEKLIPAIGPMLALPEIRVPRKTKSGISEVDMKPLIYALRGEGQRIFATLMLTERESCKPGMLMEALAREAGVEGEVRVLVTREAILGEDAGGNLVPLETL